MIKRFAPRIGLRVHRFLMRLLYLFPILAGAFEISIRKPSPSGGLGAPMPPVIVLSGLTPGSYAIEDSSDTLSWRRIATNQVVAGDTSIFPLTLGSDHPVFFRGVALPKVANQRVDAVLNSASSVSGIIYPDSGGTLALTNAGGTRFVFNVGPSNVVEPVLVRMTEVAGFTQFPATNPMRAAVVFEPDGFEFHGAGLLTIQFPTNVPHLKLSSFAFSGPDRHFGFVPDLVATNSVRVPVTHFSGVGTALWEPTEWDLAAMVEVQDALWASQREISRLTREERSRAQLDLPGSPTFVKDLQSQLYGFYDTQLKPLFAAAASDCGLATFLTAKVLGIERQVELLGLSDGRNLLPAADLEAWMCNCAHEVEVACQNQSIDSSTFVEELLGIERQRALLGVGDKPSCGLINWSDLIAKYQDNSLPCAPEWIGTFSYRESGQKAFDWNQKQATGFPIAETTARHTFDQESIAIDGKLTSWNLVKHLQLTPVWSEDTWRLHFTCRALCSVMQEGISEYSQPEGKWVSPVSGFTYATIGSIVSPLGNSCSWWQRARWQADTNSTVQIDMDVTLRAGVVMKATVVPLQGVEIPVSQGGEKHFAPNSTTVENLSGDWRQDIRAELFNIAHFGPWKLSPPPFGMATWEASGRRVTINPLSDAINLVNVNQALSGAIQGKIQGTATRPNVVLDAWVPTSDGSPYGDMTGFSFGGGDVLLYTEALYRDRVLAVLGESMLPPNFDNPARHFPVNYSLNFTLRHKE